MSSTGERLHAWMVFFVALTVIGLETVTFQALSFVADYHTATEVLSVALLGISAGGVLAWVWPKGGQGAILAAFPLAVLATLPVVLWASTQGALMMALLTVPYAVASWFLSRMFAALAPDRVYLFDLVGAGLSAVLVAAVVPPLREEGTLFLLTLVGVIPLALHAVARSDRLAGIGAGVIGALATALLVAHLAADPFNLMRLARGDPSKVFTSWYDREGKPRWSLLYSRGSLIERIDIIARVGNEAKGPWISVYNGRQVDAITPEVAKVGRLDNRLPTLLRAGEDPKSLLVGPSGQGLCKAVQALGGGEIDAVEINGAIAGLMTGPMARRSGHAYRGMDLTVGDVRTFLARSDERYDFITLLNTHRIWSMGHQGPPEYVHTLEAMRQYFDHLTDDGVVLFEERNINERADLGIRRLLHTALASLREDGVTDPASHVAIWELYHGCNAAKHEETPKDPGRRCDRRKLFTFVMIKKTPWTSAEEDHLLGWGQQLADRGPDGDGNYRGIVWRYLPRHPTDNVWTSVVQATDLFELPDADRDRHRLSIVTDDVPYPYDVFLERPDLDEMLRDVALLALVMVLLPGTLAFLGTRGAASGSLAARSVATAALCGFFGVLGLGYLVIEVVLIQKLGIFLSSPVWAVVVVLGTMLVASGFGGHFTARWRSPRVGLAMGAVAAGAGLLALGLDEIVESLLWLPFWLRVLATIALVGPLAFVMGAPFPHAMAFTKRTLGDAHGGLMFAINGALSAIAAPLTLVASMNHGFDATLLAGGALYLVCLALFGVVLGVTPSRA